MLQLAKDLEIFRLTRHAKERKDRSFTSFSPPFELFLRQHRSSTALPRRLSFFCRYGIAMTSNMVAVPQQTCQLGYPACFFFVSLYLRPLLTNEELSICSRTFVTSSMTATIEVLVLVVFLVFASVLEVLQSISCLPCALQTSLASRENFLRQLLLRVYDWPLPISVSDRSHPGFVEALTSFLTEKVP